jgi:pimeloyl-ACP methyl ester carboxylesterase
MTGVTELRHHTVAGRDVRLHVVEVGEGPLVLFVHGFPESWYSWRHQLGAVADAGFRAVALDVRGYGRSSAPGPVDAYRMTQHVADNLTVVAALGAERAVVVGHDWGAPIAWTSALLRPDVFHAVAGLSVPYAPRGSTRPTEAFAAMGGDEEFYISYFQEPGRAEAEIEQDVRRWLLGMYYSASGDAPPMVPGTGSMATVARGGRMRDRFHFPGGDDSGATMPAWMSAEDLDVYSAEFERTGFAGALNRYRNVDRDWEDLAFVAGRPITVPSLFVGGEKDGPTIWGQAAIARYPTSLPALHASVILPGCGHWVQQERPAETNAALLGFLRAL